MTGSDRERDVADVSLCLRRAARKYLRLSDGDHWPSLVADAQARAILASDWLAAHEKAVAAKALREAADAVAVMAPPLLTNALTGDQDEPPESEAFRDVWAMLRDRADRIEAEDA